MIYDIEVTPMGCRYFCLPDGQKGLFINASSVDHSDQIKEHILNLQAQLDRIKTLVKKSKDDKVDKKKIEEIFKCKWP